MRKVAYTLGELFWVEAVGCQEGGLCEVCKQCAAGTAPLGVHFYIWICDGLIRKTKMLLLRPTVRHSRLKRRRDAAFVHERQRCDAGVLRPKRMAAVGAGARTFAIAHESNVTLASLGSVKAIDG